jgi:Zn-dependent M28 family amino/carboxypeptidase
MSLSKIGLAVVLLSGLGVAGVLWFMLYVPGQRHQGPLPPLTAEEWDLAGRLRRHVEAIASKPHNIWYYAELESAARYLEATLKSLGYELAPQPYVVDGRTVRNIAVTIPSRSADGAQTVVIGAHYDSAGDAPGANDNGSGVAALLELARLLKVLGPARHQLRLVLFVNEEPPYYRTADMGSWRFARLLAERREPVRAMLSLETLGAYSDTVGSQQYPAPFGLFFPSTANFIAFVGTPRARRLVHEAIGSFRRHTRFPTRGGVAPAVVPGIDWSDHWSFGQFGYPAIMVTDTALYRYPHYHLPSDTPDKIDYERLARVTKGLEHVIRDMAW